MATLEQRIAFLQSRYAEVDASMMEALDEKASELVIAFDAFSTAERAWLAQPRDQELRAQANDARQAYGSKRGAFTTLWQTVNDQAQLEKNAAWDDVKDAGWELPVTVDEVPVEPAVQ